MTTSIAAYLVRARSVDPLLESTVASPQEQIVAIVRKLRLERNDQQIVCTFSIALAAFLAACKSRAARNSMLAHDSITSVGKRAHACR